jgi:hypothetical protein
MRLTTIWTLPGLPLRERLNRTGEAFMRGLAHRLPRRLAYWSFIDTGVRHIRGNEIVPEVCYMDLLQRAADEVRDA